MNIIESLQLHGLAVNDSYKTWQYSLNTKIDANFYWLFSTRKLGYTTSYFVDHLNRGSYGGHDLGVPMKTPIYPCAVSQDGYAVCTYSGSDYRTGWGEYVVFRVPGTKLQVWYAHLLPGSQRVKKGDIILAGDVIAKTDDSGKSTGPHVHIGFILDGSWVNPWTYIKNSMPYGGTTVTPEPIDNIREWTKGVFVSKYQKAIDWTRVKNAGYDIAYIRLGHGPSLDPYFWSNVEGADNAGVSTMPVYLPFWNMPAGEQVDWIVNQIGNSTFDYPIVIDAEEDTDNKSPVQVDQRLMTFARELRGIAYSGNFQEITLYSNHDWWSRNIPLDRSAKWNAAQWIVANYVDDPYSVGPKMPPGITRVDGWQYNQVGRVPGIPEYVCETLFNPATFSDKPIEPPPVEPPIPPIVTKLPPMDFSYAPEDQSFNVVLGEGDNTYEINGKITVNSIVGPNSPVNPSSYNN